MEKYLLFCKSIINQGAYFKGSPFIDFYLKRFANKYYILIYIFSLIFFTFINISSFGIASENRVKFIVQSGTVEVINFLQYAIILILQSFIWKLIASGVNKQDNTIVNTIKLNCETRKEKVSTFYKTIFFNGFSFRILLSGFISTFFLTYTYFPDYLLINNLFALLILMSSVLLLLSLECLVFYANVQFKINTSVLTVILFITGYLSYYLIRSFQLLNFTYLFISLFIFIILYALIRKFIKSKL